MLETLNKAGYRVSNINPGQLNQSIGSIHPFISDLLKKTEEVKEAKHKKDSKKLVHDALKNIEDIIRFMESDFQWQPEGGAAVVASAYNNGLGLGLTKQSSSTGGHESIVIEYNMSINSLYINLTYANLDTNKPLDVLIEDAADNEPEIVSEMKRCFSILASKGKLEHMQAWLPDRRMFKRMPAITNPDIALGIPQGQPQPIKRF